MTRRYHVSPHIILSVLALLILLPTTGFAASERLVLKYNDRHVRSHNGQPAKIYLKKELQRKYPNLEISKLRLNKAVVMAKSRKGKGTVQLRVDDNHGNKRRVKGHPGAFNNNDKFNYDKITLESPSRSVGGPWQLNFRGNFKLRKIVLIVDKKKNKHKDNYSKHRPWHQNPYQHQNDWDDRDNDDWYYSGHHNVHLPIDLPARIWGTAMEGERLCGRRSGNARDGWDYPDSICEAAARATFRKGYKPMRLYIRPDASPLYAYNNNLQVRKLHISANIKHSGSNGYATIGIDIGGRSFTRQVHYRPSNRHENTSLTISGRWSSSQLENARVWILPQQAGRDITVSNFKLTVKEVS